MFENVITHKGFEFRYSKLKKIGNISKKNKVEMNVYIGSDWFCFLNSPKHNLFEKTIVYFDKKNPSEKFIKNILIGEINTLIKLGRVK
jgi:hypothetical protein